MYFYVAWSIIFVYSIFLGYVLAKKRFFFERNSALFVFSTIFIFQSAFIFQGFDLTDEGFNLSKAWFMFHGLLPENLDALAGSSFINGLWLSIIGKPSIFWARLGALILMAFQYTIIFKIVINFFDKIKAFFAVLLANFIATTPFTSNTTINYNNFPSILILLAILLLITINEKNRLPFAILTAFLIVFAVFSRITFITFVVLPILGLFYNRKIFNSFFIAVYAITFVAVILVILMILKSNGLLSAYFENIYSLIDSGDSTLSDKTHNFNYLLQVYWIDFQEILKLIVLILTTVLLVALVDRLKVKNFLKFLIFTVIIIIWFFYVKKFITLNYAFLFVVALIISNTFVILIAEKLTNREKFFVAVSYFLLLFSFLGSNVGVRQASYSGNFTLVFIWSMLKMSNLEFTFNKNSFSFGSFLKISVIILISIVLFNKNKDVYRDNSRTRLTQKFKSAVLWGIYSFKERVDAVDELVDFFEENNFNDKTLLVVNSAPMLYYILNKPYYLENPWFISPEMFEKKLNHSKPPDIFIFAIKNPRNKFWPLNKDIANEEDLPIYEYFRNFVNKECYTSVFANSMFEVYVKK